jgi:hypothetical protein
MKYLQIHIDQPCSEGWDSMKPDEKGRFCASCAKTVVDFTQMTDAELLAFFKNNKEKDVCGRIHPYQLQNPLPMPSPSPVRYAQAFALAAGLALTNTLYAEPPQLPSFEIVSERNMVETVEIRKELDNTPQGITFNFKSIEEKCKIEITMFGVKKQVTDSQILFGLPKNKVKKAIVTVKIMFSDPRISTVSEKICLDLNGKNAFDVKIEAVAILGKVAMRLIKVRDKKGVCTEQHSPIPTYRAILSPSKQ